MWKKLYTGEKGGNSCKCWQPHRSVTKKKMSLKTNTRISEMLLQWYMLYAAKVAYFWKKVDIKVPQTNSPCGSFVVRTSCFRNLKSLKLKGWRVRALPKENLAKTTRLNLALRVLQVMESPQQHLHHSSRKGFPGRACGLHASGYPQDHPRWVQRRRAQTSVLSLLRRHPNRPEPVPRRPLCIPGDKQLHLSWFCRVCVYRRSYKCLWSSQR